MDLLSVNARSLEFFKSRTYTDEDIRSILKENDEKFLVGSVTYLGDSPPKFTISTHMNKTLQGHPRAWIEFFTNIFAIWDGPPLKGSFLVWAQDGLRPEYMEYATRAPLFTFCRHRSDNCSLLIPDPAFLVNNGYEKRRQAIDEFEAEMPWEKKYPVAFWRGAASNMLAAGSGDEAWNQGIRFRLCRMAQELSRPDLISAAITSIPTQYRTRFPNINNTNLEASQVPLAEFFRYKYQIDVDGYYNAWISCFTKLYSKSVLLKAKSDYMQWYYPFIKEWEHYIPVEEDLSDLVSKIEWAKENDDRCKEIGQASREFAKTLNYKDSLHQAAILVSNLLAKN